MKFFTAALLSLFSINNVLAQDPCSINFTIAYEIDTGSRNGQCAKSVVGVNNVDRNCLYKLGATTACMMSAFSFAYLPGTKENAIEAAKKCPCAGTTPVPSPTTVATQPPVATTTTSVATKKPKCKKN
ncbi:hypothetical protein CONCODRAFT_76916 [Conidiobolus coronatus NRRL 28638]|uniref:Uncharacterized protein n=1 Tax=Conidiobolus coronatus (strain ATCC 28846 / CBS 209.66 / NRRL 28638) TaxID=796925 RepID=A0A137PHE6_CONC2|nr:hypothetical protein CONCODRAFT_76916 [Conidiobolus coronatus NRRL 28638]|eukprot:KXN74410.1 hypothetical protein CONCODRAFT_76916 [Conidiobolus coronatus NRRL 28638]